jgi:serine protease AprX
MKRQYAKIAIVLCAVALLFALACVSAQPTLAGNGGIRTGKIEPALLSAMKANPHGKFAVILQTAPPDLKKLLPSLTSANSKQILLMLNAMRAQGALDRLRAIGGKHANSLALVGGGSAILSAEAIAKLSLDPFVKFIRFDRKLKPLGDPAAAQSLYTQIARAPNVWAQGITGQGIGVAVLDSGVAAADDLLTPSPRLIASVDLVDPAAPGGDPGGHGTHVAGIVAGNGADSAQARMGIASGVNIIDVRVIGSGGTTSLSTVIRGITWVVQNRRQYNIRVMNLSLGAPSNVSYRNDPLASAVEMAWASGIVVVTAGGNSGPNPGTILTPGSDPFVITVGALDDAGTLDTTDDSIAFFSSHGPTFDGFHKPDLVAPGRKIVSLRAPGSFLDTLLPDRITDQFYFRLSGTSMSSPVVAGTAALMLQKTPWLGPNLVKSILTQTARPVASTDRDSAGAGMVDAYAAVNSPVRWGANWGLTPSDEFCNEVLPILKGMPLNNLWRDPYYKGIDWTNITWDNITWDRTTWENITWENITWDNITWTNITWDNITWDTATWDSAGNGSAEGTTWDSVGGLE